MVWLDALVANVDRTARNPNLLIWHGRLWLIDHGAALYPHHASARFAAQARHAFPAIAEHVLLPAAGALGEVDAGLAERLPLPVLAEIVAAVPAAWLEGDEARRGQYVEYLAARLTAPRAFPEEAERARRAR